jgi:hypothetical protein
MPPPRGEGMTGSPPSGPALPTRARAGDPTGVRSSNPTHSPDRLTSFLLRHHKPAPNDSVDVKDLRPLTRSTLPGRSWTPTPQPALPKSDGGQKKKDQPAVGRHRSTGPALSGMTMPNQSISIIPAVLKDEIVRGVTSRRNVDSNPADAPVEYLD